MSDSNAPKQVDNGQPNSSFEWSADREPIEELAEQFAARHRSGERPTIEEYCQRHPELASEIRELFPAVITMERLNHRKRYTNGKKVASPKLPIERLGDFRVINEIARGGMGIVYEAEQVTLGRHVAVKVLPKHALRSERDVLRFQREAQTSAKLHHTNIVPVFGVGQQDDTHYIVMQLIRGVGLDEVLSQLRQIVFRHPKKGIGQPQETSRSTRIKRNADALLHDELRRDLSPSSTVVQNDSMFQNDIGTFGSSMDETERDASPVRSALNRTDSIGREIKHEGMLGKTYFRNVALIGFQAANALSHAHQHNTLHRDVKPGNLLLDDEGVVWMADFGIAKALEQDDVTCTGDLVGTVCYMAPERFEGETTELCDIYSLGLTLYELLTLSRAFDGTDRVSVVHQLTHNEIPSPRKVNPTIPRDLETIIMKAAAKNPADRYKTAGQLASDLDAFLHNRPIQARRIGYVEQFARWCQRNRAVASLAASVLLLLIAVFVSTSVGYVREAFQRKRAESTAQLAVAALDEIYGQFAPRQLRAISPDSSETGDDDSIMTTHGQLPLSNDVAVLLENLLQFYDDLSKQSSNNNEFVLKSIRANRRVGDIQHRLGELDKAHAAYERAIESIQQLTLSDGAKQELDLEYARTQNGLGMVLEDKHMCSDAAAAHCKARDRLDDESELPAVKYELARTLYLMQRVEKEEGGKRNKSGDKISVSPEHDTRAIAILTDLSKKDPTVSAYQFLLAKCYLARAFNWDNPKDKRHEYAAVAIEILEELVKQSPNIPDYRYELGDAYVRVVFSDVFHHRGNRNDQKPESDVLAISEKRMRRALQVTTDIELNHPNIPEYVRLKSRMHHTLARILKDQDLAADAEEQYDLAIEKQRLVVRQSRNPIHHEVWRLLIELHRARLQRDMQKYDAARENLEAMISELQALIQNPDLQDNSHSRRMAKDVLSKGCIALSDVLRKTGQVDRADKLLREAELIQ